LAFCSWAGKRLCGRIGGGSLTGGSDSVDATKSQRYSACSAGGTKRFPYGNTEDQSRCVFTYHSGNMAAPVRSDLNCVGGYPGIYDMIGNVQEWEDACDETDAGPNNIQCLVQGGDYQDTTWDCAGAYPVSRNDPQTWVGFRCCAD